MYTVRVYRERPGVDRRQLFGATYKDIGTVNYRLAMLVRRGQVAGKDICTVTGGTAEDIRLYGLPYEGRVDGFVR